MDGDILSQVRMQSTMYNRTMQSGYSELMGLLPPGSSSRNSLTRKQVEALQPGQPASPPFKVRGSEQLQASLGTDALPNGFQGIPIYNYLDMPMADDLDLKGCGYVDKVDAFRFPNDDTYASAWYLVDLLNQPIAEAFGLDKETAPNMSFMELYGYCDDVQSDSFEFPEYQR